MDATKPRNGAEALVAASAQAGVDVCFANPGTTEMSLVAALGAMRSVRPVLVAFEGVASGAADGYARLARRPAATLLHLGPGLANASANLHNARRGASPVVNWVGDHATWMRAYDPPLASNIEALANVTAGWVRSVNSVETLADDATSAVGAATSQRGSVATLIVPDDVQKAAVPESALRGATSETCVQPERNVIDEVARRLRSSRSPALLLGNTAVDAGALRAAARVAKACSAALFVEQFPRALRRGGTLPEMERLHYLPEMARPQLAMHDYLLLVGADQPVCFFGYPGERPLLTDELTEVRELVGPRSHVTPALEQLADALDASMAIAATPRSKPALPSGELNTASLAAAIATLLPEDAVVVDEGITSSPSLWSALGAAAEHDYLSCKGGSIGWAIPAATGAAIAAPGRRVVALVGDGSASYTIQGLWTQARESLDVTTIVAANRRYAILQMEAMRMGASIEGPGGAMATLDAPPLDFSVLARGFGVTSWRVTTVEECVAALRASLSAPGPAVIEAILR